MTELHPRRRLGPGRHTRPLVSTTLTFLLVAWSAPPATAGDGVSFRDVAQPGSALADYRRAASLTQPIYDAFVEAGELRIQDLEHTPHKWRGAPGVAVLDYDGDGDLDLFVTNGPGRAHSLFQNRLAETGALAFVDVATQAGVAAVEQDGSGVCFGDTDNDGDPDLFVVSPFDANRLFENNGDGTFTDVTAGSGLDETERTATSCSFGDVNGDGLLDVAVANNNLDWRDLIGVGPSVPFGAAWHNQLYLNQGGNVFTDVSQTSGIEDLRGFPEGFDGFPSVTWAIALVDVDSDGDADIVHADDGGVDRGFNHLLLNDGTGHFTDVVVEAGLRKPGMWMGLAFADFDDDGRLDFFSSNVGDWAPTVFSPHDPVYGDFLPYQLGDSASRWFLGRPGGTFADPGVGALVATPFGWGASAIDYDNDADVDIVFHGGLGFPPVVNHDNPGAVLRNDGSANFTYDLTALENSTDHRRRTVHGLAAGDLDGDGFADLVSVSSHDVQDAIPLATFGVRWGSPLDGTALYQQLFVPSEQFGVWPAAGHEENVDGTLSVEISSGNGNGWVKVRTLGGHGLVTGGKVNRDGIGAVVTFTTHGGRSTMRPVLGGSSYASQDSLELGFGLGAEAKGTVDVLWPGGVRNRLSNVHRGDAVLFPEIPCGYDADWPSFTDYQTCVETALDEYVAAGVLDLQERGRFFASAVQAFDDAR